MESAFLTYGVPVLASVVSAVLGHWFGSRKAAVPSASAAPAAPAVPAVDPVLQAILSKVFSQAQSDGHAALDAIVAKLLPSATPMLPAVNAAVTAVENAVVK